MISILQELTYVDVYYNNNIARERLVIENLIKGIDEQDAKSPIPSGTKLLNITVTDGVCYVNFDSTFLNVDSGMSADVVVYSIVNSLTELDNINKVQLLVNGASSVAGNNSMIKLGTSYERDATKVIEAVEREILNEDTGRFSIGKYAYRNCFLFAFDEPIPYEERKFENLALFENSKWRVGYIKSAFHKDLPAQLEKTDSKWLLLDFYDIICDIAIVSKFKQSFLMLSH